MPTSDFSSNTSFHSFWLVLSLNGFQSLSWWLWFRDVAFDQNTFNWWWIVGNLYSICYFSVNRGVNHQPQAVLARLIQIGNHQPFDYWTIPGWHITTAQVLLGMLFMQLGCWSFALQWASEYAKLIWTSCVPLLTNKHHRVHCSCSSHTCMKICFELYTYVWPS